MSLKIKRALALSPIFMAALPAFAEGSVPLITSASFDVLNTYVAVVGPIAIGIAIGFAGIRISRRGIRLF